MSKPAQTTTERLAYRSAGAKRRKPTISVGDRVRDAEGDVGIIIEANALDAHVPHNSDQVFVAWATGVRTWTPTSNLELINL